MNALRLSVFDEQEVNFTPDHFQQLLERNNFDQEKALSEWLDLSPCEEQRLNPQKESYMASMFTDFTETFCNVLMLIEILPVVRGV